MCFEAVDETLENVSNFDECDVASLLILGDEAGLSVPNCLASEDRL